MSEVFEGSAKADPPQVDVKTLHAKIGELDVTPDLSNARI